MAAFQPICGLVLFVLLAAAVSENRRGISWKVVGGGVLFQLFLAATLLRIPFITKSFFIINELVDALDAATKAGSSFVFGYLGGGNPPFSVNAPENMFVIGFRVLPIVIVMSALSAVLFHLGILQRVSQAFAILMRQFMKLGGSLSLGVAASVFLGMIEAPILVRPYLKSMNRSELFTLMTAGMATVAGSVMILYATILSQVIPDAASHLLIASLISAPAAVMLSLVMIPNTTPSKDDSLSVKKNTHSLSDALVQGSRDGLNTALSIAAIIIVLFALVSLVNQLLSLIPMGSSAPLTLQMAASYLFAPFCWCMGIPMDEMLTAGNLMATKTILNELVAYQQLAELAENALRPESRHVMLYAICGFANFGSLGILLGGLSAILPERREEIAGLCLKSMMSGTLATMMTGAVVALVS